MSELNPQPIINGTKELPQGHKYCTHCGILKKLESFDAHKVNEDGKRNVCKACRKDIRKREKANRLSVVIEKMEDEGLKTLSTLDAGGTFDPHINEVFEAMLKPFGGVHGWSKHLFATYLACEPGGAKRIRIHSMLMNLANQVTKLDLAERQLDMMEERDLLAVMGQHLKEYQKGNKLPKSYVPTIEGSAVDAIPLISEEQFAAMDKEGQPKL